MKMLEIYEYYSNEWNIGRADWRLRSHACAPINLYVNVW